MSSEWWVMSNGFWPSSCTPRRESGSVRLLDLRLHPVPSGTGVLRH